MSDSAAGLLTEPIVDTLSPTVCGQSALLDDVDYAPRVVDERSEH
jgi:hypothetical protein